MWNIIYAQGQFSGLQGTPEHRDEHFRVKHKAPQTMLFFFFKYLENEKTWL